MILNTLPVSYTDFEIQHAITSIEDPHLPEGINLENGDTSATKKRNLGQLHELLENATSLTATLSSVNASGSQEKLQMPGKWVLILNSNIQSVRVDLNATMSINLVMLLAYCVHALFSNMNTYAACLHLAVRQ